MIYTTLVTLMTTIVSPVFFYFHLEIQNTQKYHILYGKFVLDVHLGITLISQIYIYFIFLIFQVSVYLLAVFEDLQLHFVVR